MSILTPDQRLRVFVSSTLRELADERVAIKDAIQAIRLAPVMFEMGARPHPPRNLYRAYLEQSHLFVGVYWQSYGWVAPEMEISGLEDEYLLAGDMPKLIYIKEPANEREPRLQELLDRVLDQGGVSVRTFRTVDELREMVPEDLALLLTERFSASVPNEPSPDEVPATQTLPAQLTRFIGRTEELKEIQQLLLRDEVRLLTLVGPGGIGKSRLSIEIGERVAPEFPDGVRFVPLAAVRDPSRLFDHLVEVLGIKENTSDSQAALSRWLQERSLLLILDNFEQLLGAGDVVARLLEASPSCKVLVTSRAVLRLRGEHEYFVPPMTLPKDPQQVSQSDAVELFRERADEVRPGIDLTDDTEIVSKICRRLDGLPLAIELAAARIKVMSPKQLLERLASRLDVLVGGARDLPERQKTLRSTLEWSYDLLGEEEKTLFARLAVFRRGATLEAIETICAPDADIDVLEAVASLIEKTLLRQEVSEVGEARFWMLETIREFATELLEASDEAEPLKDRHAHFFEELCDRAKEGITGSQQQLWFAKVELDYPNIRLAANRLLTRDGHETVARMAYNLVMFSWVRGHLIDARRAAEEVLKAPELSPLARAQALAAGGAATFWQGEIGEAVPALVEAMNLFEQLGERLGYAQCLLVMGMIAPDLEGPDVAKKKLEEVISIFEDEGHEGWLALGTTAHCWILMMLDEHEGLTHVYERAVEAARASGAELTIGMSYGNLGQHRRWQGRLDEALALQIQAIKPLIAADHVAAISYTFQNAAEILTSLGRLEEAARLIGLGEAKLEQLHVLDISLMNARRQRFATELCDRMGEEPFEAARTIGRGLTVKQGVELMTTNVPAPA
jgi:predicted ATPase